MIGSLLSAVALLAASPAQDVAAAVSLLHFVEPAAQQQTRFLALSHIAPEHRHETAMAVTHLCNAVSRNRIIFKPTATDLTLAYLRLDLAALSDPKSPASFGEVLAAWEALTVNDPRYHVRTNVATTAGLQAVTVDAGHVGLANATRLREMTGSQGAILAADYFISRVATTPDYYQWAGLPATEAELFAQLGLDAATVNALAADSAANIIVRRLTGRSSRILAKPTPLGWLWHTKDSAENLNSPERSPFRAPVDATVGALRQVFVYDAGEYFFHRANGYWGVWIGNGKGQRADAVTANVATDTHAPTGRQELRPMIGCYRCHSREGTGHLQDFTDHQSRLAVKETTSPEIAQRIAELYSDQGRVALALTRSREDFERAVLAATGVDGKAATEALAASFARYQYDPVTLDTAAAECGVDAQTFIKATEQSDDPIIQTLREGVTGVNRRDWEASFGAAATWIENWKEC